jgi:hypothetical protein
VPFGGKSRYLGQFEPKLSQLGEDDDLWWVVPFTIRYAVGVVGRRYAGSSTVLSFMSEKLGFHVYSLSHELRRIARAQGVPLDSRRHLQDLGDELRAANDDGGYLARLTLQRIRADLLRRKGEPERIAVGGFKHAGEVAVFEQLGNFHLLGLRTGTRRRYERGLESGLLAADLREADRTGESKASFSEFRRKIDERDRDGRGVYEWTGDFGQQVDTVMKVAAASKLLPNDSSDRGKLFARLSDWIRELDDQYRRPEL